MCYSGFSDAKVLQRSPFPMVALGANRETAKTLATSSWRLRCSSSRISESRRLLSARLSAREYSLKYFEEDKHGALTHRKLARTPSVQGGSSGGFRCERAKGRDRGLTSRDVHRRTQQPALRASLSTSASRALATPVGDAKQTSQNLKTFSIYRWVRYRPFHSHGATRANLYHVPEPRQACRKAHHAKVPGRSELLRSYGPRCSHQDQERH